MPSLGQYDAERHQKACRFDSWLWMKADYFSEDEELGKQLLASEKDRAEHIMLVDLARNDVNRVCQPKTVQVDHLMRLERFSHVTHLTSQVSGMLREDKNRSVKSFDSQNRLLIYWRADSTRSGRYSLQAPSQEHRRSRQLKSFTNSSRIEEACMPAPSVDLTLQKTRWTCASQYERWSSKTASHIFKQAAALFSTALKRTNTSKLSTSWAGT